MTNLFEINPLNKIYHASNLEKIRAQINNSINDFKEKAPDKTDYILAMENAVSELSFAEFFLNLLYKEIETQRSIISFEKTSNYKLAAELESCRKEVEKLNQIINL